jgi:lipopolysaccharide assembly outer membrane protein LptD (OstA)
LPGADETHRVTGRRLQICAALLAAGLVSGAGVAAPPLRHADGASTPVRAPVRAPASSFPALQGPLNVTADEITVDNTGAQLTARGHVRLTYAEGVATANMLRLRRLERTAEFSGNVVLTDPKGKAAGDNITVLFTAANQISKMTMAGNASAETKDYALQGDNVVADRAGGRLVADGHITLFTAPDLIVNGDHALYDQANHYGLISGHVAASNRLGRMAGDWLEFFQQKDQAVVHGPVTTEVYGATITGGLAQLDFSASTAVFSEHVQVVRRQGTLIADRVTIFYKTRQLIAQGNTHAHFTELESDNP